MSSVTMDEETTDGQAADTEDEIQRQTNKIRKEIEKERKQKVKVKHSASSKRAHAQTTPCNSASNESSNGCGISPTMAAIAAANHSYHQALYTTPSLSSCASASTPNLANSALYEPIVTFNQHQQQHCHQMVALSPEQYYQQMAAALHNAQHVSPKVRSKLTSKYAVRFRKKPKVITWHCHACKPTYFIYDKRLTVRSFVATLL